jgi:hypothetical protein
MTQIQVWLVNSRQPSARSRKKARPPAVATPSTAGPAFPPRRPRKVTEPVDAERPPRADGGHEHAGQERPQRDGAARDQALQGVGLLQSRRADDLGHEAGIGGAEEGLAHAHPDLQRGQLPDLGHAGDKQRGGGQLQQGAPGVGGEHHAAPRQAVGPHAAEQHEHDERDQTRRLDDADVRSRSADGEHREGQRDHAEHGADHRGRLSREELAELGLAQRGETVAEPGQATRCAAGAGRASPGSTSSSARAGA